MSRRGRRERRGWKRVGSWRLLARGWGKGMVSRVKAVFHEMILKAIPKEIATEAIKTVTNILK